MYKYIEEQMEMAARFRNGSSTSRAASVVGKCQFQKFSITGLGPEFSRLEPPARIKNQPLKHWCVCGAAPKRMAILAQQ
jgi:hypothetical protein